MERWGDGDSQTATVSEQAIADDRETIQQGDRTLPIVEDDLNFARILLDMARQQGFKGLVAGRGDVGIAMAQEFRPSAIVLDIRLPVIDGWTVLDRLKHDPNTRHIPIHIMSVEEGKQRCRQQGAIAFWQKPISTDTILFYCCNTWNAETFIPIGLSQSRITESLNLKWYEALFQALSAIEDFLDRPVKNLLVVEDDDIQRHSIVDLIGNSDVASTAVETGKAALEALKSGHFDCLVLDLGLPDMSGFDLIEQIKLQPNLSYLPIVVYTGKELSPQEETRLRRISDTIIVKDVRSPERLLDETALFLHRVQANLPPAKRQILEQQRQKDPLLAGKTVLIVDDDVRKNIALTSLLERYQMQVLYAENGRDGITMLQDRPDINIVLMDVMMPEEYYTAAYDAAIFHSFLKENIVFSPHNLVTDASFNEFNLILCRNVLIYFDRQLQQQVHKLLYESLRRFGVLGLGKQQALLGTPYEQNYKVLDNREKIYRRVQ